MKELRYGLKPGVGPVLKIMRDDVDNPLTTPITEFGKFQFDSETTKLGYVYDIEPLSYDSGHGGSGFYYLPSGTNVNTCETMVWSRSQSGSAYQDIYWFSRKWDFGYMPIVEYRQPSGVNLDTYDGPRLDLRLGNIGYGYIESYSNFLTRTRRFYNSNVSSQTIDIYDFPTRVDGTVQNYVVSTMQLPVRDDPLPDFTGSPVSGQEPIRIDGSVARIALPGHTYTDTNLDHFILHENKIPAKVMASGDINVAVGGTATIDTPLPLTKLTYMDFHVKRQSLSTFWNPPYFDGPSESQELSFTYQVLSQSILITNTADTAITIRYAIFSDSDEDFTTGGEDVLVVGNDGVRDYIQIKRPSSSDADPKLNDILIDTRLAYLPIIAEGFLAWPGDFPTAITGGDRFKGERMATVSFDAGGLLPFVKQYVIFPNDPLSSLPFFKQITAWGNYHQVFVNSGSTWSGRTSGWSSWAEISDDSVNFYMAGANPMNINSGGVDYGDTALGLRYYIFGIPASL